MSGIQSNGGFEAAKREEKYKADEKEAKEKRAKKSYF